MGTRTISEAHAATAVEWLEGIRDDHWRQMSARDLIGLCDSIAALRGDPVGGVGMNAGAGGITVYWRGDKPEERGTADLNEHNGEWWVGRCLIQGPQHQGLGRRVLMPALVAAREQGATEVFVSPGGYDGNTKRQRRFYMSLGFKQAEGKPAGVLVWR